MDSLLAKERLNGRKTINAGKEGGHNLMANDRQSYYDDCNQGEDSSTFEKAIAIKKKQSLKMMIKGVALYVINATVEWITCTFIRRSFEVHRQKFRYFLNGYSATSNERCAELPFAMDFIFGILIRGKSIKTG